MTIEKCFCNFDARERNNTRKGRRRGWRTFASVRYIHMILVFYSIQYPSTYHTEARNDERDLEPNRGRILGYREYTDVVVHRRGRCMPYVVRIFTVE